MMADDDLDLTGGDPAADEDAPRRRRRRRGTGSESGSSSSSGDGGEVSGQLHQVADQLVDWRESKGDDELAQVIREDGEAMIQGIITLTKNFVFLLKPLLIVLNVVVPLLAFAKLLRILYRRIGERRYARQIARAASQAGMTPEEYVAAGYPDPTQNGGGVAADAQPA